MNRQPSLGRGESTAIGHNSAHRNRPWPFPLPQLPAYSALSRPSEATSAPPRPVYGDQGRRWQAFDDPVLEPGPEQSTNENKSFFKTKLTFLAFNDLSGRVRH